MFDGLISGKLFANPQTKTAKTGSGFVTARILVSTKDGNGLFASVICFNKEACKALAALSKGDSVAVAGEVTAKAYLAKDGEPATSLDVLAHSVTTLYQIRKKRQASEPEPQPQKHYTSVADIPDDLF